MSSFVFNQEIDRHTTHLNVLYEPLEVVDVPALVASCTDRWYNQSLSRVNDSVVRLGVVEGEYHWHKHDDEDEFFYMVEGRFIMALHKYSDGMNKSDELCNLLPVGAVQFATHALTFFFPAANALQAVRLIVEGLLGNCLLS